MTYASSVYALIAICLISFLVISLPTKTVGANDGYHIASSWAPTKPGCQGIIAECLADDEFELDSEFSRRILASSRYISYGALQRNSVPCSQRGASYYNCKKGAQANPYSRGCSAVTRCRS